MPRSPCHDRPDLPLGHVSIGDCAFAPRPMLLTTVLGSCVCATFHHPGRRAGGMFHAMLPDRGMRKNTERTPVCTFADLAVEAMVERFRAAGMAPDELVVKLFGGANTMEAAGRSELNDMLDVGAKNVRTALAALAAHGLAPTVSDVLGPHGRKLYFATATGEVWLSYLTPELARKYLAERKRC
ncbi:chemotaxis protein CheD [Humidesulfovibrio mexicanus]|uniref:Probable chemoreceptor glutamine deamidase CheD n=1 Tax=Humidesulfovibrio mexicanus TaxID=147047 RepID=A0A239BNL3_9BACT|nr:chemotaxis protein CheD [Humidesulfovibrio mexicanus]SNS09570.1 chemotaxis protein CheD [Humidesulfovibrio mexicanus]